MYKFALGLCLSAVLSSLAFAGETRPGFDTRSLDFAPPIFNATFTLNSTGETILFDGNTVERIAPDGTSLQTYGTLPGFGFPSFVTLSEDRNFGLVGENSTGVIYSLDLKAGTLTSIGTLAFNYGATIDRDGVAYISAAATASPDFNDIYRIDLAGAGIFELIAQVPGFSGPVALESNGDLLVGLAADPDRVVRFTDAQVNGGVQLSEGDSQLVTTNWNGIAQMTVDHKTGNLFIAEHDFLFFTDPAVVYRAGTDKSNSEEIHTVDPGLSIGSIQLFSSGTNDAIFSSFQPERGGTMVLASTDFFSTTERVAIRPVRPRAMLAGPGFSGPGDVTFICERAFPGEKILIVFGQTSGLKPHEIAIPVDGIPFFWSLNTGAQSLVPGLKSVDTNGRATYTFDNTGGTLTGLFSFQAAIIDDSGALVGCTPVVSL